MSLSPIKYRFAQTECGNVIDIYSLSKENMNLHSYYCPYCKQTLTPVLGDVREHHFRHVGKECDYQNYFHSLAERVFIQEYEKCIKDNKPFVIEYEIPARTCTQRCQNNNGDCKKVCNLVGKNLITENFNTVTSEHEIKRNDTCFRPDIILSAADGRQLWIEIYVTHKTCEKKLERGPIIELKIESEDDIKQIQQHCIRAYRISNLDDSFLFGPNSLIKDKTRNCQHFIPLQNSFQKNNTIH